MKTLIYLFFATIVLVGCNIKNHNNDLNGIKTEKFDAKIYENLPLDSTKRNTEKNKTYISGNKRIQVNYSNDTTVFISNTEINSPYSDWKKYSIATNKNQLRTERKHFHGMPIGIHKEYDEDGNVIKETDFDEHYTFTTDDLIKKMKKEYNVDILNRKNVLNMRRLDLKDKEYNLRLLSDGKTEIENKLKKHRYVYFCSINYPCYERTKEYFLLRTSGYFYYVEKQGISNAEYTNFMSEYYHVMYMYYPHTIPTTDEQFRSLININEEEYFERFEKTFPEFAKKIGSKYEYQYLLSLLIREYYSDFIMWSFKYFYIDGKTGETIFINKGLRKDCGLF